MIPYKPLAALLLVMMMHSTVFAQADTAGTYWTPFTPAVRLGAGFIPKLYLEAGVALHKYHTDPPNSASQNIYAAIEATTTMYGDRGFLLLAPKVGYQFQAMFYAIGMEAKYQSDGGAKDFVLAPKAGLSVLGMFDIMYAYQLSFNNRPFPGIGAHQFSLALTLYRRPFMKRKK